MQMHNIMFSFGIVLITSCISLAAEENRSYLAPYLNKKYILAHTDEKFDEVMKALGVGLLTRNLGKLATPVIQLTEQDGQYTLTSDSAFKNIVTKFRIGEKFKDETPDGRQVESLFIQDKNTLVETQTGDKTTTITREFTPEEVRITVAVDDIVSVRVYKLIN